MNIEQHFLPEHISEASEEYWRVVGLMKIIMENISEGELYQAKHISTDLTLSLHKLTKLSSEKYKLIQ